MVCVVILRGAALCWTQLSPRITRYAAMCSTCLDATSWHTGGGIVRWVKRRLASWCTLGGTLGHMHYASYVVGALSEWLVH